VDLSPPQEDDHLLLLVQVIDPVSGSVGDPQLGDAAADRLCVSSVVEASRSIRTSTRAAVVDPSVLGTTDQRLNS
jgi:hypothetical protein